MDEWMDDGTDGWNDASRRPLLYVIILYEMNGWPDGWMDGWNDASRRPLLYVMYEARLG